MEALQVYLRGEALKWRRDPTVRKDLLELDEWSLVSTTTDDTPQQNNGSDCGAFTCTFAKYVDEGLEMNFTCDDMKNIRVDITCSLLHAMEEVSRFETAHLLVALWDAGDELRELWISTAPDARDDAAVYEQMDAEGKASWRCILAASTDPASTALGGGDAAEEEEEGENGDMDEGEENDDDDMEEE